MIIIGYQGIGKSTLAKDSLEYIDLESGNFWVNGERDEQWYKPYCNIANHLSAQGYTVFTSSHKEVREELKNSSEIVKIIFPSLGLKTDWLIKLTNRYNESMLEKDYKALINASLYYEDNINDLMNEPFDKIVIDNINYNLRELIEQND